MSDIYYWLIFEYVHFKIITAALKHFFWALPALLLFSYYNFID